MLPEKSRHWIIVLLVPKQRIRCRDISSMTENTAISEANEASPPLWYQVTSRLRVLGTPAPVFPGYEIDMSGAVTDADKQEAVWHRDRAKAMLQAHPEIKELFGQNPWTQR